jgi:ATP-dependent Clp protease ATP-binding subunit ClpC
MRIARVYARRVFDRFTERARMAVVLAQDEARALRHGSIGTEHLLLGLMRKEDGVAARLMREAGVGVAGLRDEVRALGPVDAPPAGQIPFTPGAKAALEGGLRESLAVGHTMIGTEHILLGMIRHPEPQVVAILAANGVEIGELVARVERALPVRPTVETAQRQPLVDISCTVCGASLERVEVVEGGGDSLTAEWEGHAECPSCGQAFTLRYSIEWRPA